MSWQLASLAIVVASLALCFWWYERSRPSSKEVALVATMAALAALGRDAFAALPDVKPTTTIVLICGYAFGAGPGFAVGAVGALASNIFLGQGSWTPWQMIAWAVVGVAGAMLGLLLRRRPLGRWTLALACALAAEIFNLLIDLYSWSVGGTHTLAAYGAWLASALAFDMTHVVASFLFGLTFGPALLRMLIRARTRMEIVWQPLPGAAAAIAVALLGIAGLLAGHGLAGQNATGAREAAALDRRATVAVRAVVASAQARTARLDISRELSFLAGAQNPDGGFGGARGQSSSELYTGWVAIGLAAAGREPLSVRRDGHTVLDALRGEAASLQGAGDIERTILALHACGVSVRSLPGGDPVARLLGFRDGDGSFGRLSNLTAFAIFALRAAGYSAADPIVRGAARWLSGQQEADGGFGFGPRGGGSDVDDTAAVLQAIVDAGTRSGAVLAHATSYLIRSQNPDGGYPERPGGESNAQSTAWAIQGLIAAGKNVEAITREGSRSPLGYLASLLAPDGSVRYSRTGSQTPVWVTAQALTALAGKPFPIAPVRPRASRSTATASSARAPHPRAGALRPASGQIAALAGVPARSEGGALPASDSRRLDALAQAVGSLLGSVLAPMLR